MKPLNLKKHVIALAAQQDLPIETVRNSATLERNGGVGCLLRYLPSAMAPALTSTG